MERRTETGEAAFDAADLLQRVDNDRELLQDLLQIFKDDYPKRMNGIREAVSAADMKGVTQCGHALKGMLANLSARRAAAAAGWLEQMGKANDKAGLQHALAVLDAELAELVPKLENCAAEVGS